jgi:hypothetical protein
MNTKPVTPEDLKLTPAEMEALAAGAWQFVPPVDPRDSERYLEPGVDETP